MDFYYNVLVEITKEQRYKPIHCRNLFKNFQARYLVSNGEENRFPLDVLFARRNPSEKSKPVPILLPDWTFLVFFKNYLQNNLKIQGKFETNRQQKLYQNFEC